MSTDFYDQLRGLIRWLDRPGVVIMNEEFVQKLEVIRLSLTPPTFAHVLGSEYLDQLVSELSDSYPWPINQKEVLELLRIVYDLPRLAVESSITSQEAVMSNSGTLLVAQELVAADRCDRCGAAAQLRAVLPTGSELLFCGHHGREHEAKLMEQNATVYNEQGIALRAA